jgi:DNA replication protein DnaD
MFVKSADLLNQTEAEESSIYALHEFFFLSPALRQNLLSSRQPGLHSEFQYSHSCYREKSCLKTTTTNNNNNNNNNNNQTNKNQASKKIKTQKQTNSIWILLDVNCDYLNRLGSENGIVREYVLIRVVVSLLEEVCHFWGGL